MYFGRLFAIVTTQVMRSNQHLLQCKCIDPKNLGEPPATCAWLNYKGDGNCDDENNNKGCEYDGGDCCYNSVAGGVVKKKYCKEVSSKWICRMLHDYTILLQLCIM